MMNERIEHRVNPNWDQIDDVCTMCEQFLSSLNQDQDVIHALTMVSGELVENAVKYGSFEGTNEQITYLLEAKPDHIMVEVKSPLAAEDDEKLDKLDQQIQWIRGFQSPFEAYVEKLKEISIEHMDEQQSGLGLVRIAYEGQSILDFYIDEDDVLSISAVYRI